MLGDHTRVAEVLSVAGGRARCEGTGFVLATGLALTAAHVVEDGSAHYEVGPVATDPEASRRTALRVVSVHRHPDPARDLALLVLDARHDDPPEWTYPPKRLGAPEFGIGTVPYTAVGLPLYAVEADRSPPRQLSGGIQLGSDRAGHRFQLTIETADPVVYGPRHKPHKGASGAAILVDDLVVGVLESQLADEGTKNATAAGLRDLGPEFGRVLREHGVDPEPSPVRPAEQRAPSLVPSIVSHEELVAGLGGRRSHLLEKHLPFVSPGADGKPHPCDPGQLLKRLALPDARGVLLTGAAGAGKSRTCFEVAALAAHNPPGGGEPWRVLHVQPDSQVSNEDLAEAVLSTPGRRVLVVLDYLDTHAELDLRAVADLLRPQARRDGIEMSLIGSARPGSVQRVRAMGSQSLFDEVPLRHDAAHQAAVVDRIMRYAAPDAFFELGERRLGEICGGNPVIALLIARDLERNPEARRALPKVSRLGNGDLLAWLQLRMRESGLALAPAEDPSPLVPVEPSLDQLAGAVAAAACPQPRAEVERAVRTLLEARAETRYTAADIVDMLLVMGWLQLTGGEVRVLHDVVTDELLHRSLLPSGTPGHLHRASADAVFGAAMAGARTLGLFAGHLRRVVADLAGDGGDPRDAAAVEEHCRRWLTENGAAVGRLLADTEQSAVHTLVTLVSSRPWQSAVLAAWDTVVLPWLEDTWHTAPSRRFLTNAVQACTPTPPRRLTRAALRRLADHPDRPDAGSLISALLDKAAALEPDDRDEVVRYAFAWLDTWRGKGQSAFVLRTLLRTALPGPDREGAVRRAVDWPGIRRRHEAGHILPPLLDDIRDRSTRARRVIAHTLAWLKKNIDAPDAGFVTQSLFACRHLVPGETLRAAAMVRDWLVRAPDSSHAPYRFREMFERTDVTGEVFDSAADWAVEWLTDHHDVPTGHVIAALLAREGDLGADRLETAVARATAWIRRHPRAEEARHVLKMVLYGPEPPEPDRRDIVDVAFAWFDDRRTETSAASFLEDLLKCRWLQPSEGREATVRALGWLGLVRPEDTESYGFVVRHTLTRCLRVDDPGLVQQAMDRAVCWLGREPGHVEYAPVLRGLFRLRGRVPDLTEEMLTWLRGHPGTAEARMVLPQLLKGGRLTRTEAGDVTRIALEWLRRWRPHAEWHVVATALLAHARLTPDQAREMVGQALGDGDQRADGGSEDTVKVLQAAMESVYAPHCHRTVLSWIAAHPGAPAAPSVVRRMLSTPLWKQAPHQDIDACALDWLAAGPPHAEAADLVTAALLGRNLARRGDLVRAVGAAVLTAARPAGAPDEGEILTDAAAAVPDRALRLRRELTGDGAEDRWRDIGTWCSGRSAGVTAARRDRVLAAFRSAAARPADSGDGEDARPGEPLPAGTELTGTLTWLTGHGDHPQAGAVLHALLSHRGFTAEETRRLVAGALHWLAVLTTRRMCLQALRELLSLPRLEAADVRALTGKVLARLDADPGDGAADDMLNSCLLTSRYATESAGAALDWLDGHRASPAASLVLRRLLNRPDLTTAQATRLQGHAMAWLYAGPPAEQLPPMLKRLLRRDDLPETLARDAAASALDHLDRDPSPGTMAGLLPVLLHRDDLDAGLLAAAVRLARAWPATSGSGVEARISRRLRELGVPTENGLDSPNTTGHRQVPHP